MKKYILFFPFVLLIGVNLFAQLTSKEIEINDNTETIFKSILPSLIAIVVAIIGFTGSLIAIKSSKNLITKQIQSAKEIAELNFRQQVLSTNRKDWIENLRNKVSALSAKMLVTDFKENEVEEFEGMKELIANIELMLNPQDNRDLELITLLTKLPEIIDSKGDEISISRRQLLDITKSILKSEWEKIEKGEFRMY
jgi:hypothetical protein